MQEFPKNVFCLFWFLIEKIARGKKHPGVKLVGTHLWVDIFFGSTLKSSQKELVILMHFIRNTYRDKWFHIEKQVLSR